MIEFDALDDRLAAERATLAANLRRIADTIEHGAEADAIMLLARVRDQIVALVQNAAPFMRGT